MHEQQQEQGHLSKTENDQTQEPELTPSESVADREHRMWALANVRRNNAVKRECAEHPGERDAECVTCAYHLGRIVGQIEAGAYWTHDEVMERMTKLTERAPVPASDRSRSTPNTERAP